MLTGENKKTYMRIRRAKEKLYKTFTLHSNSTLVRPKVVRPIDADGNVIYDE